jgi:hypothetical protein
MTWETFDAVSSVVLNQHKQTSNFKPRAHRREKEVCWQKKCEYLQHLSTVG